MKYDIDFMNKRVDAIYVLLESINDKLSNNMVSTTINNSTESYIDDLVSIDNDDDLEKMEDKLTNDKQFKAFVVCSMH